MMHARCAGRLKIVASDATQPKPAQIFQTRNDFIPNPGPQEPQIASRESTDAVAGQHRTDTGHTGGVQLRSKQHGCGIALRQGHSRHLELPQADARGRSGRPRRRCRAHTMRLEGSVLSSVERGGIASPTTRSPPKRGQTIGCWSTSSFALDGWCFFRQAWFHTVHDTIRVSRRGLSRH